jgi:hypothetical protein
MDPLDWDDPAVVERWCGECRRTITDYLAREGVVHGGVGPEPAWHLAPYISIWAIESLGVAGSVGWWAICGDLPTDYLSAANVKHPRNAMLAFADIWKDVADCMAQGKPHPSISFGPSERSEELASLLENRSGILRRFAENDAVWNFGT